MLFQGTPYPLLFDFVKPFSLSGYNQRKAFSLYCIIGRISLCNKRLSTLTLCNYENLC